MPEDEDRVEVVPSHNPGLHVAEPVWESGGKVADIELYPIIASAVCICVTSDRDSYVSRWAQVAPVTSAGRPVDISLLGDPPVVDDKTSETWTIGDLSGRGEESLRCDQTAGALRAGDGAAHSSLTLTGTDRF